MAHVRLDELARSAQGTAVFGDQEYLTPLQRVELITLDPQQHSACGLSAEGRPGEQGYVILRGTAQLASTDADMECHAHLQAAPGWLLGPAGRIHQLSGHGPGETVLVRIQVDTQAMPLAELRGGAFNARELTWRAAIHGGSGRLATRHVLRPEQFASTWTFLDHAILGPSSSLGYHYHEALEECFLVLRGTGHMTLEGHTFVVGPGSAVFQPMGAAHGLYNPQTEPLEFIRIAVALADAQYTTVDVHDDLRRRLPTH